MKTTSTPCDNRCVYYIYISVTIVTFVYFFTSRARRAIHMRHVMPETRGYDTRVQGTCGYDTRVQIRTRVKYQ